MTQRWRLRAVAITLAVLGAGMLAAEREDAVLLRAAFEDSAMERGWQVQTKGGGNTRRVAGPVSVEGKRALAIEVAPGRPRASARLLGRLPRPVTSIEMRGHFSVSSRSCAGGEVVSNPPLMRVFDAAGHRRVGLVMANVTCRRDYSGELFVEHSDGYHPTRRRFPLDRWHEVVLQATSVGASPGSVRVVVDGEVAYESGTADTGRLPFREVAAGNELPGQASVLLVDAVQVVEPVSTDANACRPRDEPRVSGDHVVLADGFESGGYSRWNAVTTTGAARVAIEREGAVHGRCTLRMQVPDDPQARASLTVAITPPRTRLVAEAFFLVHADGAEGSNTPLLRVFAGGSRLADVGRQNRSGAVWLRTPGAADRWEYTHTGVSVRLGSWHSVRITLEKERVRAILSVQVDSHEPVVVASDALRVEEVDSVMLGSEHFSQEMDLSIDDVVIVGSS